MTYRLSEKREGTPRETKKYPLPNPQLDFKGSLPWDLEVWLPSDSFCPGGPGDGHLGIYNNSQAGAPATPHPPSSSAQIPNFLRFMGTILGHNLEWFCSVPHVKKLFKGHLLQWAGARRTGPWVLMLWRVRGEEKPWLVLREVGKELGRGQWWYGQGRHAPPLFEGLGLLVPWLTIWCTSRGYSQDGAHEADGSCSPAQLPAS